ncbi:hypothetical protein M501DRAFT_975439 [Patellaria atrata CBS 101060]|uniref:Ribosome biogenesis protein Urb1 n=1 Tax=Patellaria atrata CBS 101060 TaxID=1346257 RepID=A0A9P4SBG9_9PEZI|nr:hypothetical protein M501DRAFT_975439 [Patellaria atrata CBS 101060]
MSKRPAQAVADERSDEKQKSKRPKLEHHDHTSLKPEEVFTSRQLHSLLNFRQDDVPRMRNGIQSFKVFLETILYPKEEAQLPRQRTILEDYLESQKPKEKHDKESVFLSDLMQIWAFSNHTNNEYLFAALVSVLALLMKTLSSHSDFKQSGLLLCRTVLNPAQLKLISRGHSASKHKDYVISPCIRLLTQIVSFEDGAMARLLYSRRDYTFDGKVIARNLSIFNSDGKAKDQRKKPSVRSNSIRYLLANFKYQDEGAKIDILKQGYVIKALFDNLKSDTPETIISVLSVIKSHIISDKTVPRYSKANLLTERSLESIANLYRYVEEESKSSDQQKSVDVVAHEFLMLVCTNPDNGVLLSSSGWYGRGSNKMTDSEERDDEDNTDIDLGIELVNSSRRRPPRNITLATFAQSLRPYADLMQQGLLLAIFEAAPELVTDYFYKKKNFSFDAKLTSTWIGYSSFLFSVIQLPIPEYFGHTGDYATSPPPVNTIIESILPHPANQQVLTRCLNQSSNLITFFAVRLLVISFQKLKKVLKKLGEASKSRPKPWQQTRVRLLSEFIRRCPSLKDVVFTYKNTSGDDLLQREAVTHLLKLYYQVTPQIALDEKFDASLHLVNALSRIGIDNTASSSEEEGLRILELEYLLEIATYSPNMRWWQKPESLPLSPFITILKLAASNAMPQVKSLLVSLVREYELLDLKTSPPSLDALLVSLPLKDDQINFAVLNFLDECFSRLSKRPIKYLDDLESLIISSNEHSINVHTSPTTICLMVMVEQWLYISKSSPDSERTIWIADWLASLFRYFENVGVNPAILMLVQSNIITETVDNSLRKRLEKAFRKNETLPKLLSSDSPTTGVLSNNMEVKMKDDDSPNTIELNPPPGEKENHHGLHKWSQKEVDEAVQEGSAAELILCLCSKYPDIRRQALYNIRKLMGRVKASEMSYEEWEQIYLLLGELVESASPSLDETALPYVVGTFATRALAVQANPDHILYAKVNTFLLRGPTWEISKLPTYWIKAILLNSPTDDDGYHKEVEWLMDWLIDGLRTPEDLEIFRTCNVYERIISLFSAQQSSKALKRKILGLLIRTRSVEGGSMTLMTRNGILSWIESRLCLSEEKPTMKVLSQLARQLYEACDSKANEWSHGGTEQTVQRVEQLGIKQPN